MSRIKALLIDDDREFCQTFELLARDNFDLTIAHSGKAGLAQLNKMFFQVVLLDLKLGRGMNGLEVLKKIKKDNPDLPVIMVTDFADVPTAVQAMKLGALHYTSKSPNINALKLIIERQLEQVNWKKLYQVSTTDKYERMVFESPVMKPVLQKIEQVADTNSTILIEGESGTGKEITAREIHRRSQRRDQPFVAINCSTLAAQLFENELFGHEKGAFTSADARQIGKMELANQGTLFLDEIGDLPYDSQAKILRAIENRSFQRLGGTDTIQVDVRIIAASNKKLHELVQKKLFREDLYYRLNVITIRLPELKERPEDIPLLVEQFLRQFADEMNRRKPTLTPAAMKRLQNHRWKGNIRELKNFIERLMVLNRGKEQWDEHDVGLNSRATTLQFPPQLLDKPYEQAKDAVLLDFKEAYFRRAFQKYGNKLSQIAKQLHINRATMYKILQQLKQAGRSVEYTD